MSVARNPLTDFAAAPFFWYSPVARIRGTSRIHRDRRNENHGGVIKNADPSYVNHVHICVCVSVFTGNHCAIVYVHVSYGYRACTDEQNAMTAYDGRRYLRTAVHYRKVRGKRLNGHVKKKNPGTGKIRNGNGYATETVFTSDAVTD